MADQNKYQKLELTWIGKGDDPKLEPRILVENPQYSYGDPSNGNILIHGDNLLALKALEQDYSAQIKCVYIDPPYNTGSAFEHYDDGVEHSLWLNLLKPRLELLRKLIREDGSVWISIDDNEVHYLKILCDEVFGRTNFIDSIIWQKIYTIKNSAKHFSGMHEYILVYAKNIDKFKINLLPRSDKLNASYLNPDNDIRGPWTTNAIQARNFYSQGTYEIKSPSGKIFKPPQGTYWRVSEETYQQLINDNRIWWGKNNNSVPRIKKFLDEAKQGVIPATLWLHGEVGQNAEAKEESRNLFGNTSGVFLTPKPEKLIKQIITLATNEEDIILDSFLGSGTSSAVAHKMNRKWIGVELGDHAVTHCYTRLKMVVDGEQGGISKSVGWEGGGGFKFYTIAASLLNKDKYGNWVISSEYDPQKLAAAMAKQEGFRYTPHQTLYWKQGVSSEQDFIFTTTQFVTVESLDQIQDDMHPGESLLICCKSYQKGCQGKYKNITIKKIPQMLLGRCEFGKDDYSLNIVNMPVEDQIENDSNVSDQPSNSSASPLKKKGKRSVQEINKDNQQLSLFD